MTYFGGMTANSYNPPFFMGKPDSETCKNLPFPEQEKIVLEEVKNYIVGMKRILLFIDDFYVKYNIDNLVA